jgi:hypothetical protein
MTQQATSPRLSPDEIAAYNRDGYVVPRFRFVGDELGRLQRLMSSLVQDNPGIIDQPVPGPHVPGSGVQGLKVGPGWAHFATHPEIVNVIEQVVGPDIVLWGTTVFYKRALEGPPTPWHRDGSYWPIKPLATTSIWIAVTESTAENGCLRVIAGSHQARDLGAHVSAERGGLGFHLSLPPEAIDESLARDVELEPGQMVMFDVYSVHGARPSRGGRPRAGYSLRFMPSTSHYDHDGAQDRDAPGNAHHTRPLILVRGVDRCGRNDFRRGHPRVAA